MLFVVGVHAWVDRGFLGLTLCFVFHFTTHDVQLLTVGWDESGDNGTKSRLVLY